MSTLTDAQEAYGHEMWDYLDGKNEFEVVERDDGHIDVSDGPKTYCAPYRKWPAYYKQALRQVRGRVLDIGCGAGRHAIYLQEQGFDVLGIDISPLAIEAARRRGLQNTCVMSITEIDPKTGRFDTVLMLGNNFGLFGGAVRARRLFKQLYRVTGKQARIIAESTDPYRTDDPDHLAYHARNSQRGRMPGQVRIRVRYKSYASPWFDYLLVSQQEMQALLEGSGWTAVRFIGSGSAPQYIAIIEKC